MLAVDTQSPRRGSSQPTKPNLLAIIPPYSLAVPPHGSAALMGYLKANGCDDFDFLDLRLPLFDGRLVSKEPGDLHEDGGLVEVGKCRAGRSMAPADPEMVPVTPDAHTATRPGPPTNLPAMARARFMTKSPAPERSRKAPKRMNMKTKVDEILAMVPNIPSSP